MSDNNSSVIMYCKTSHVSVCSYARIVMTANFIFCLIFKHNWRASKASKTFTWVYKWKELTMVYMPMRCGHRSFEAQVSAPSSIIFSKYHK